MFIDHERVFVHVACRGEAALSIRFSSFDFRYCLIMSSFLSDLRFGARLLLKSPLTSAAAILSLALGIGGTTTMFSAVDAVLLRPLPFAEPERLVLVSATSPMRPAARPTQARRRSLAGRLSRLPQQLELRRAGLGFDASGEADRRRHTRAGACRRKSPATSSPCWA